MKIFISWSKNKSRLLAEESKKFIQNVLGHSVDCFFSPEMYKGTRVDNTIHENLLKCDKCLVCITSENFKNPWMLYEAGVVFGANFAKTSASIVIPILFDYIPDWSSWVDKPLNQYVPIQLRATNQEFSAGKKDFKMFLTQLASESGLKMRNFEKQWESYQTAIGHIMKQEQLIPDQCKYIVDKLLENNNGEFSIVSPLIEKEHIVFHRGFATTALIKLLLESIMDYQGKRLWFYGRRNKKLLSSENDVFFKYLATEGLQNGVDFKCLLPYPDSDAVVKATSKDKERSFITDLQSSVEKAVNLKMRFHLPTENLFRLYRTPRVESIIVMDNAILHRRISCDGDGYPMPYTNSEFEVLGVSDNTTQVPSRGNILYGTFLEIWEQAVPLTKELYTTIYGEKAD